MDRGAWWATVHGVIRVWHNWVTITHQQNCPQHKGHPQLSEKRKWKSLSPTLCNPLDYTVHGILQARILEWVAFPSSRGSSQPRDWTQISRIAGEFFTSWVIREDLPQFSKTELRVGRGEGRRARESSFILCKGWWGDGSGARISVCDPLEEACCLPGVVKAFTPGCVVWQAWG